ncbi:MAG: hypothetical protein ACI82F_004529 [Planctomycetota bacterium]|jgi:hypothetical protein
MPPDFRKIPSTNNEYEVSRSGQIRRISDGFMPTVPEKRNLQLTLSGGGKVSLVGRRTACEIWHRNPVTKCTFCGPKSPKQRSWGYGR